MAREPNRRISERISWLCAVFIWFEVLFVLLPELFFVEAEAFFAVDVFLVVAFFAAYFCLSGKVEQKNALFYQVLSISGMAIGAIWIILGVVNLFITAVVSISKKKNARIELLDGTRIPAFIIGMLLILMSKLFSV